MKAESRRPLWRLLLSILNPKSETDFTCDECFRMFEYLADIKAQNTVTQLRFQTLIKKHLAACPECREHFARVLEQMESQISLKQ